MNRAMRRHTARSVSLSGLGASALAMVLAVPLGARAGGSVPSSELAAAALTDRLIIKYRAGLAAVALTDAAAERACCTAPRKTPPRAWACACTCCAWARSTRM